jgi:AbrB family looped-hinge helix DNA binding protein
MVRYKVKQASPTRAREVSVKYATTAVEQPSPGPGVFHVTVTDRGRLVLPAEVRERLNIRDGDKVSLTVEDDGAVTLQTREVAIRRLRGMFKHVVKPGRLASDELIAERRREARKDDREFQEWDARLRKAGK